LDHIPNNPELHCPACGAPLEAGSAFCPYCGTAVTVTTLPQDPFADLFPATTPEPPAPQPEPVKEEKPPKKEKPSRERRWNPGPVSRIFLRIGSVLLSLVLSVALFATVLTVDMQTLTSESTIEQVIESVMLQDTDASLLVLAKNSKDDDSAAARLQDKLVDMIYDVLKKNDTEGRITATKDQISEFLSRSDSDKFLSNKISGLMDDLINGTDNTRIRSSDVIKLLERNEDLALEVFGKDVNEKMKTDIKKFMDDKDIDRLIHKEIFPKIRESSIVGILSVSSLLSFAQMMASPVTLILLILLDIVLIGLLLLTHWLRIGATMRCVGTCFTSVGSLFAVPTLIIQLGILPLAEELTIVLQLLTALVAVFHYVVLGIGILLLISSLIVRIIELKTRR